MSWTLDTGLI